MRRTAHAPSARNRPTLMVGLSGPLLPLFVVVFAASAFWPAGSAAQGVDSSRVDTTLWMANGLVTAFQQLKPSVPFVVRLDGTNDEEGRRILAEADLPNVFVEETMLGAASSS